MRFSRSNCRLRARHHLLKASSNITEQALVRLDFAGDMMPGSSGYYAFVRKESVISSLNGHGIGTRFFRAKETPVWSDEGAGRRAPDQAKLVGVAQPDRARLIGFSALASRSSPETPGLVPGLDDLAMVGGPVKQRGVHLCIAEGARPFAEGEVGDDDAGDALVELRDQMERATARRLGEGQIAEFVEHDEVEPGE